MKKLIVFALFLALSVFAFQGTSHAVLGVVDDVPGTDVMFPIICEKGATMNTLYAVAEVWEDATEAGLVVYDRNSEPIYDDVVDWTPWDVLVGDCQALVAGMSPNQQVALETEIGGRTYYVGYVALFNFDFPNDQLISWIYLVDLPKGFASGFNGFQAEGLLTSELCEFDWNTFETVCQNAVFLFPRYLIMNDLDETWNWWIVVYGSNFGPRELSGVICNEEEDCISLDIPAPDELNIIDVEPYLPVVLHADYPKAGFGWFFNTDVDFTQGVFGWSYQRAEGSTVAATWDVTHPIHGLYFPDSIGGF